MINDAKTLELKVNQLNEIFLDVRAYKQAHPESRCGYYTQNIGSLLNAYREGDITFDECLSIFGTWKAAFDMQQAQGRVQAIPAPPVPLQKGEE